MIWDIQKINICLFVKQKYMYKKQLGLYEAQAICPYAHHTMLEGCKSRWENLHLAGLYSDACQWNAWASDCGISDVLTIMLSISICFYLLIQ